MIALAELDPQARDDVRRLMAVVTS